MNIPKAISKQPLPKQAKKVFEGVIFEVYQWEQEMFDGSVETFEKLKRPDTVIVFPIFDDGKILLTREEQPGKAPFIGAAGGRAEKGEGADETAKRELLEETGYIAKELILWKSIQPISKIEWSVYVFIARGLEKIADQKLDAGEKIEPIYVNFDEFLKIAMQPNFCEQEIYRDVAEATMDPEKREKLRIFMMGA